MPFFVLELGGRPLLVCEAKTKNEVSAFATKMRLPATGLRARAAAGHEELVLKVERALAEEEGRDPSKIFGVRITTG